MKKNVINDNRCNEVEFLQMYLNYFENLIDPEVYQRWKIEQNDEKLYSFCEKCIDRIKLMIDYATKNGTGIGFPSDASLEIATVYQTLLEHFEEVNFDKNNEAKISIDTYVKNKGVLLKEVTPENITILKELFHNMEVSMPEYLAGFSSLGMNEEKASQYDMLLENIQILKYLKRFRELQIMENALFFTTPEESEEELNETIRCYVRK